jgi:putative membrane protein insertion efficiency factor
VSFGTEEGQREVARGARISNLLVTLLTATVRAYQVVVAPWLGPRCRFHPSCSHYALEALATHGAARGLWLTGRRLLRCQPLSAGGIDPVPPPSEPCSQEAPARG